MKRIRLNTDDEREQIVDVLNWADYIALFVGPVRPKEYCARSINIILKGGQRKALADEVESGKIDGRARIGKYGVTFHVKDIALANIVI